MIVNLVVEGQSDTEAAKAVVRAAGHTTGKVIPKGGQTRLDPDIGKYNEAAQWQPWVVIRDTDGKCPVTLYGDLVAGGAGVLGEKFQLRLAHSMTEAWLLADRRGFASFFGISESTIIRDPESLAHPKQEVLRLCSGSNKRDIRRGMVASDGDTGPEYVAMLNRFAKAHWNVEAAVQSSDSLRRAVERIRAMGSEDE